MVEPEVYFRIVHVTGDGHHGSRVAAYREQTVEISLGPKDVFKNGSIGALTRRKTADTVANIARAPRRKLKLARELRTPRVVELLRKAMEWQALLDSGTIASQADISRQEGITRGRVTQVIGML
ncbi:MAG: hypothetical protein WBX49_02480, partial [Candidatus Deferrimicrobiaceae bacterium]